MSGRVTVLRCEHCACSACPAAAAAPAANAALCPKPSPCPAGMAAGGALGCKELRAQGRRAEGQTSCGHSLNAPQVSPGDYSVILLQMCQSSAFFANFGKFQPIFGFGNGVTSTSSGLFQGSLYGSLSAQTPPPLRPLRFCYFSVSPWR